MTENDDGEKSAEVVGRYGKEYSRLRRLTSNLDVIQQSVCSFYFEILRESFGKVSALPVNCVKINKTARSRNLNNN